MGRNTAILLFLLTCSRTTRTSVATCDTLITISSNNEDGCIKATGADEEYECPTLQTALDFLEESWSSANCTEIQLSPTDKHSLRKPVDINVSVLITSRDQEVAATITVEINVDAYLSSRDYDPLYVLNFNHAQYVGLERIEISGSPGIIGITNVDFVEIKNSSFRLVH